MLLHWKSLHFRIQNICRTSTQLNRKFKLKNRLDCLKRTTIWKIGQTRLIIFRRCNVSWGGEGVLCIWWLSNAVYRWACATACQIRHTIVVAFDNFDIWFYTQYFWIRRYRCMRACMCYICLANRFLNLNIIYSEAQSQTCAQFPSMKMQWSNCWQWFSVDSSVRAHVTADFKMLLRCYGNSHHTTSVGSNTWDPMLPFWEFQQKAAHSSRSMCKRNWTHVKMEAKNDQITHTT